MTRPDTSPYLETSSQDPLLEVLARSRPLDGPVVLPHRGNSMTPALPSGCSIRIEPLAIDERPKTGDVVAFVSQIGLVSHRIIETFRRDHVLTRGDALWLPDPPTRLQSILGIVTEVQCHGTWSPVARTITSHPSRGKSLIAHRLMSLATSIHANVGDVCFSIINRATRWRAKRNHKDSRGITSEDVTPERQTDRSTGERMDA